MRQVLLLWVIICVQAHAGIGIATYNIRNFQVSKTNQYLLKSVLEKHEAAVWVVQEIVDQQGFTNFISRYFPNYAVHLSRCGGFGKQKLGFVYDTSKLDLLNSHEDSRFSENASKKCGSLRPAFIADFFDKTKRETYTIVALHLKAGGGSGSYSKRWRQYRLLTTLKKELSFKGQHNVIFAGDFNSTGYDNQNTDYQQFQKMLKDVDGKSVSENIGCTSYWSGKDRADDIEEPSTLDHIILTGALRHKIKEIELGGHCQKVTCNRSHPSELGEIYKYVSDHCPVGVFIE